MEKEVNHKELVNPTLTCECAAELFYTVSVLLLQNQPH